VCCRIGNEFGRRLALTWLTSISRAKSYAQTLRIRNIRHAQYFLNRRQFCATPNIN